jgi:hypothetical protein
LGRRKPPQSTRAETQKWRLFPKKTKKIEKILILPQKLLEIAKKHTTLRIV